MTSPDSDSVYFDAPTAMQSSQDFPQPKFNEPSVDPFSVGRYNEKDHINSPLVQHPSGSQGWLPTEDLPVEPKNKRASLAQSDHHRRATSTASRRASTGAFAPPSTTSKRSVDLGRSSSKRSTYTASDGRPIQGSAFLNGPGATGPLSTADSDEDITVRTMEANASLTPKQKSKIAKTEAKNGKRLSKIIREEGKTEKNLLSAAIDELAGLQKLQKNAVKSEARTRLNHSKHLAAFKQTEAAYLSMKTKYEIAQSEVKAEEDALDVLRNNAREATERMQDKAAEVDSLRQTLAVDEREREVRLSQLKGPKKSGLW